MRQYTIMLELHVCKHAGVNYVSAHTFVSSLMQPVWLLMATELPGKAAKLRVPKLAVSWGSQLLFITQATSSTVVIH